MSFSGRIDLENLIFARAKRVHAQVHAKQGRLSSPSQDLELQTLLYVYNAHFSNENFHAYSHPQEALLPRQLYLQQTAHLPLGTTQNIPLEMNFELALLEGKTYENTKR